MSKMAHFRVKAHKWQNCHFSARVWDRPARARRCERRLPSGIFKVKGSQVRLSQENLSQMAREPWFRGAPISLRTGFLDPLTACHFASSTSFLVTLAQKGAWGWEVWGAEFGDFGLALGSLECYSASFCGTNQRLQTKLSAQEGNLDFLRTRRYYWKSSKTKLSAPPPIHHPRANKYE